MGMDAGLRFLQAACLGPPSDEKLQMILESEPGCQAPCWRGIVPDKSTGSDLLALRDASPAAEFADFREIALRPAGTQYSWNDNTTHLFARVGQKGGTIDFVAFSFSRNELPLRSVLEAVGQPDSYTADIIVGHEAILHSALFFEKKGVVAHISLLPYDMPASANPPNCEIVVSDDMPVYRVIFTIPDTADAMKERLPIEFSADTPAQWPGMGTIPLTDCRK